MLILPDADIDYTTDQLISAFGSSGQRCMALSVAVVSDIKDEFIKILREKYKIKIWT